MEKTERDFFMRAFMDDMAALSLVEKKWGIKFSNLYDLIRDGRISDNDFQCMIIDFVNLCRKFWLKDGE